MSHWHIAQDVPNALARYEFDCHVSQCSRGEWEECERRIQLAQQLDEQASGVITLAARRSSSSKNTALSDYLSPNAPLTLRHRAWPLITLAIAVAVNLA